MTCETTDAPGMEAWERAARFANETMHAAGRAEGLCRRMMQQSTAAAGEMYRMRLVADLRDALRQCAAWAHQMEAVAREAEREELRPQPKLGDGLAPEHADRAQDVPHRAAGMRADRAAMAHPGKGEGDVKTALRQEEDVA